MGVGVVVGAAVVVTVLHKLVSQQVGPLLMVPIISMKGRLVAAAHRFSDVQPKAGEELELSVTVDEISQFYYSNYIVVRNNNYNTFICSTAHTSSATRT